jgi:hypothetical protein
MNPKAVCYSLAFAGGLVFANGPFAQARVTAAAKRSTELASKAEGPKSGCVNMNEDLIASLH